MHWSIILKCCCFERKLVHIPKLYTYLKYSKHWLYTLAHTTDCVCSKMLNHGLNHGSFLSLFKFSGWKYILNWIIDTIENLPNSPKMVKIIIVFMVWRFKYVFCLVQQGSQSDISLFLYQLHHFNDEVVAT